MFDSCMTHNIEIIKNKPMSHNSWLEENFWQNYPSHFRSSKLNSFDKKKLWLLWSLAPVLMQQRFLIKILKNQLRLRLCVGGSEIRYVWVLLTVLSEKSTFGDILVFLLIRRFIWVAYQLYGRKDCETLLLN